MSDTTAEATATDATDTTSEQPEQKPTETVDFWKSKAREQEKRAKENADAAKRLAEIEDAQKSESQKAGERIAELEAQIATSQREALRFKVAARFGIADEDADLFLTGGDEETITRQAERLAARSDAQKKNGNFVPREGATTPSVEGDDREVVKALFG